MMRFKTRVCYVSYSELALVVVRLMFVMAAFSGLTACSSVGVEPWQRDVLSRPEMQFGATDLTTTLGQHFYFSRESSTGGSGFAGGGCGCN